MRLERDGDGIFLSAAVRFELPASVIEVLEKGIAVYFVADATLLRERWYWTDQKIRQAARHMRLVYQPLTRRWRLSFSSALFANTSTTIALNQNFDTLEDALNVVQRVSRLRLADAADLSDDGPKPILFRFRLDTTQLPRPFQIGLLGQVDWNIALEHSVKLPLERSR